MFRPVQLGTIPWIRVRFALTVRLQVDASKNHFDQYVVNLRLQRSHKGLLVLLFRLFE